MWPIIPLTLILLFNGIKTFIILPSPEIYNLRQEFWEADNKERQTYEKEFGSEQEEIWLLDVVPGDQKLRRASDEESRLFEDSFGDMIEIMEQRRNLGYMPRRPKTAIAQNTTDGLTDKAVLDQIRITVNKFVLSSLKEREQNLDVSFTKEADPSITLYIKSPYSGIVISYGDRQWNFFLQPPSPLPVWLYELHRPTYMDVKKDKTGIDVGKNKTGIDVGKGKTGMVVGKDKTGKDVSEDKTGMDIAKVKTGMDAGKSKIALDVGKIKTGKDVTKYKTGMNVKKGKTGMDVVEHKMTMGVGKYKSDMDVSEDKKTINVGRNKKIMGFDKYKTGKDVKGKMDDIKKEKTVMDIAEDIKTMNVGKYKNFMGFDKYKSVMDVKKDKTMHFGKDKTLTNVDQSKDFITATEVKETSYDAGSSKDAMAVHVGSRDGIQVPSDVQSELYRTLLRYLKVALRFDLS